MLFKGYAGVFLTFTIYAHYQFNVSYLRNSGQCSNYKYLLQHYVYPQTSASVTLPTAMSDCALLQLASRALKCVKCCLILCVTQSCSSKFCAVSVIYLTSSVIQTAIQYLFYVLFFFTSTHYLILILLTWTIWQAPTNASKWRMGFNSAFKGLILSYIMTPSMPKITARKVIGTTGLNVCVWEEAIVI